MGAICPNCHHSPDVTDVDVRGSTLDGEPRIARCYCPCHEHVEAAPSSGRTLRELLEPAIPAEHLEAALAMWEELVIDMAAEVFDPRHARLRWDAGLVLDDAAGRYLSAVHDATRAADVFAARLREAKALSTLNEARVELFGRGVEIDEEDRPPLALPAGPRRHRFDAQGKCRDRRCLARRGSGPFLREPCPFNPPEDPTAADE